MELKKLAHVVNGRVIAWLDLELMEYKSLPPENELIDASEIWDSRTTQEWAHDGTNFIQYIEPVSLQQLTRTKLLEINQKAQAFIDAAIPVYPEFEKLTFDQQEREAIAYLADNTVATPTLTPIANARGLSVQLIAEKVVAKAGAFRSLAAAIAGQRQAYEDQLQTAVDNNDADAINAITVSYAMSA